MFPILEGGVTVTERDSTCRSAKGDEIVERLRRIVWNDEIPILVLVLHVDVVGVANILLQQSWARSHWNDLNHKSVILCMGCLAAIGPRLD